jgi:ABC-2 type transport system ATP-binding protein
VVAREGEWLIVDLDPSMSPNVVWRELLFSGWPITEIRRAGGGLEDLYLTLTERRAA